MDEDRLGKLRPFGTTDATQWSARFSRSASLAQALWGRTAEDLREQLQKPHPDIPLGFDLADFQELLKHTSKVASVNVDDPRNAWIRPLLARSISVGTQRLTEWDARVEIIRRSIEYLEGR